MATYVLIHGTGSGGWLWDQDGGKKTDTPSCLGSTRHFRIYAPPASDRFYNPDFGYYVVGTTHYDHHELCNSWFDDSEECSTLIAAGRPSVTWRARYTIPIPPRPIGSSMR